MRNCLLTIMGLAVLAGPLAHAETPLTPSLLGQVSGILSWCETIDSGNKNKFEVLQRSLTSELSHRDLEMMEKNANYRSGFDLMQSTIRTMAPDVALQLCKNALKQDAPSKHDHDEPSKHDHDEPSKRDH
jgi:hypothetical protein